MKSKDSLYEAIDVSRAYKSGQEVKHKLLLAKKIPEKNYLELENLSNEMLEVRFTDQTDGMFVVLQAKDHKRAKRHLYEDAFTKDHTLYVRTVQKAKEI